MTVQLFAVMSGRQMDHITVRCQSGSLLALHCTHIWRQFYVKMSLHYDHLNLVQGGGVRCLGARLQSFMRNFRPPQYTIIPCGFCELCFLILLLCYYVFRHFKKFSPLFTLYHNRRIS